MNTSLKKYIGKISLARRVEILFKPKSSIGHKHLENPVNPALSC